MSFWFVCSVAGLPTICVCPGLRSLLIHQIPKLSLKSQCECLAYNLTMICPDEQILLLSLWSWWSWESVKWFLGLFFFFLPSSSASPSQSAGDRLGLGAFIHQDGCSWNVSHQPWWFSMSGTNTLECQIMCRIEELFYCTLCSDRYLVQYW